MLKPLPCPFCGSAPMVQPANSDVFGDAWAAVACLNDACAAQPRVEDGETIADNRGSDAYKEAAIHRWNQRAAS